MSVVVTARPFLRDEVKRHRHPDAVATLVDGRGNLLVLDSTDFPEESDQEFPLIGTAWTIRHTIASYREGEWQKAVRS